jgi:hypothetical protein
MTGRYDEAAELYKEHLDSYRMLAYENVFTSFFSILMLTSISERRQICNTLESIVDQLNLYGDMNKKIKNPLLNLHFNKEEDDWQVSVETVALEL